jgi:predicted ester cyclase
MPVQTIADHERIWAEGLNRGDLSVAPRAFAPDCLIHITGVPEPIRGIEAWTQFVAGLLAGFPDLHFTIEDQVGSGDRIAFRWRATGTHTGPLGAVPPTGRRVALDGLIVDHLLDGRVVERWEQWDQPGMLAQLGLA